MENEEPYLLDERKKEGKPLVLVVDNDAAHRKLLDLLAERLGITVYSAKSCSEALEVLALFSFDVVLMDCRMPDIDGYYCTNKIRNLPSTTKNVPIIAVTADGAPGNREKCIAAGMNDFLSKPFTLTQLHDKLCYWLDKKTE